MTFAELLARIVDYLEGAGIPYMVTGSVASTFHGEPRATIDLDVVIDPKPEQLARLVEALVADGWYVDPDVATMALRDRSQFNVIGPDAIKVDFIVRKDRPFSESEFGRRRRVKFPGVEGYVVSVEDLILAKLEWAAASDSERQRRDVAGMVAVAGNSMDRSYIAGWADRLGVGDAWRRVAGEG